MSGPTKAGEPSMEEILASIRKIIADDPSKSQSPQPSSAPLRAGKLDGDVPLLAKPGGLPSLGSALSSAAAPQPSGPSAGAAASPVKTTETSEARANPSFGRLSEALRGTFATSEDKPSPSFGSLSPGSRLDEMPPVPFASSSRNGTDSPPIAVFGAEERSRSIESELDDILNEPLAGGRLEHMDDAKKPAPPAATGGQWAVWRTSPGKPDDTGESAATAKSGVDDSGQNKGPVPPMAPSLGRSSGGFYPSSGGFIPTARIEPTLSPPGGTPLTTGASDAAKSSPLNASIEERDFAGSPAPPQPTIPRFNPKIGTEVDTPSVPPPAAKSGKPAPVVIAAMPPVSLPASTPPAAVVPPTAPAPSSPAPVAAAAASATPTAPATPTGGISVPLPPRATLFSRPFSAAKPEPTPVAPSPLAQEPVAPPPDRLRPSSPPAAPTARAGGLSVPTSALDALAAGLAASNVSASSAPPSVARPGPAAAPPASPGASRSLEDSVAEMIKPMLQKWIDDNMPRIIERALRNETGGRSGS